MTTHGDVNVMISDWLIDEAGRTTPDYLGEILARTSRTRQRPAWSSLERWLPVQLTFGRLQPVPRLALTIALLAALALLAAALLAAGVGRRPLPHFGAQANGDIAFVDGSNLNVAGADGSGAHVVGMLPSGAESLTFSPDGTRMAYRTTSGTTASIFVANADGSQPINVTPNTEVAESAQVATNGPFSWSPDSARLAFAAVVSADVRTIDIVNVDGSHLTQSFPGAASETVDRFDPAWSPDGQWISFFTTDANKVISIAAIHPDGSGALKLGTLPPDPMYLEMKWSPDPAQRRLAYVSGGTLRIFDLATSATFTVANGFFGSWSPDGKRVAWWDNGTHIALVDDVLGGHEHVVSPFPAVVGTTCAGHDQLAGKAICSPASWSPDSEWVFGPDVTGTSIVFGSVDGSKPLHTIPLVNPIGIDGGAGTAAWQPIAP